MIDFFFIWALKVLFPFYRIMDKDRTRRAQSRKKILFKSKVAENIFSFHLCLWGFFIYFFLQRTQRRMKRSKNIHPQMLRRMKLEFIIGRLSQRRRICRFLSPRSFSLQNWGSIWRTKTFSASFSFELIKKQWLELGLFYSKVFPSSKHEIMKEKFILFNRSFLRRRRLRKWTFDFCLWTYKYLKLRELYFL